VNYVVKVCHMGKLVVDVVVKGMVQVEPYIAAYDSEVGFELEWFPDTFGYMAERAAMI
jgi:hypothetical protein